ncbi:hypothetical protein V6N12_012890 [Hibiscus sabdariffa]|uniref:Uncharacterized protein n=1 Tax=Hibiscus sabdariffa TaxID=183260 RepID=A0ABR2EG40_9ROSI
MSDIRQLTIDIKVLARQFSFYRFTHTGRACSRTARAIVPRGLQLQYDRSWAEDAHEFVLQLAAEDRRFQDPP